MWRLCESSQSPRKYRQALLTNLLLSTLTSLFAHNMNRCLFNASLCREIVDWSMCLSSLCPHYCWLFLKREGYSVMVATIQYHVTGCWGRAWGCRVKVTAVQGKSVDRTLPGSIKPILRGSMLDANSSRPVHTVHDSCPELSLLWSHFTPVMVLFGKHYSPHFRYEKSWGLECDEGLSPIRP